VIAAVLAQAGTEVLVAQNIFFAIVAVVAVAAALRMVTTSNVVHAALYLMIVLAAVAATFVILAAEFIAASQVLVYIGAIVVLLLFGVMLTRARIGEDTDLDYDQKWVGGLVAVFLFVVMSYSLWDRYEDALLPDERAVQRTAEVADSIFATYIVPFEAISVILLAALIGAIVVARRD
jgi:NADH-quinone oxidoreductase subunit J